MNPMDLLNSSATAILAVSIAAERFVAVIKTLVPSLGEETKKTDGSTDYRADRKRRLTVMFLAFLGGWMTAAVVGSESVAGFFISLFSTSKIEHLGMPNALVGFLASGGSALWTSVVSYASAAKDIKTIQRTKPPAVG